MTTTLSQVTLYADAAYPVSAAMIKLAMPAELIVDMRCAEHLVAQAIDRVLDGIAAEDSEECRAAQLAVIADMMQRHPNGRHTRKAMQICSTFLERRHKVRARIALLPLVRDQAGWLRSAFTEARNCEWPVHRIEALAALMPLLDLEQRNTSLLIMLDAVGEDSDDGDMDKFRAMLLKEEILPALRYMPALAYNLAAGIATRMLVEAMRVASEVITDPAEREAILTEIKALRDQPALAGTPIT